MRSNWFPALLTLYSLGAMFPITSLAQEIDVKECFRGEKYVDVIVLFDRWNERELELAKESFKDDFESDVIHIARINNKSEEWVSRRIGVWRDLKPTLSPQKRLSAGAQSVLLALYGENTERFLQRYREPRDREYRLTLKLYPILSLAQEYATDSREIQASHVFEAVQQAWTGLWPFCPEKTPGR